MGPLDRYILTFERIKDRYWTFSHENGTIASEFLKFQPDGTVSGYNNNNEKYWKIQEGLLSFLSNDRIVTVTFDFVLLEDNKLLLKGKHRGNLPILCLRERDGRIQDNATKIALAKEIENYGWSIGDHTYGVPRFIEKGMAKLKIGKYCSIAGGVYISFGNHRVDTFTTFPFKAKSRFWEHVPIGIEDHSSKGDVIIGNDVWIGTDVFIGSGVTIDDGAIIGAKSVITKNVPPYAIVVGNPGRIVRYRFTQPIIKELLELSWWNLRDEIVDSLLPFLMSNDAPSILSALRQAAAGSEHPGASETRGI